MAGLDTVVEVEAPEHLAFRARIAGPGRRMFAWVLDLVVRAVVAAVLVLLPLSLASVGLDGFGAGAWLVILFLLDWFYFVACEMITGGRSPGKMALKLRVVRSDGLPITWRESLLRNFVRAADICILPGGVVFFGPLVMACDRDFRRLGDLAAGTLVVVEEATGQARAAVVGPDERMMDELPALLPLDRSDLEALELFVSRDHMNPERREELARVLAPVYATRFGLASPDNATAFLGSIWARSQDPRRKARP